ncbi:MAG: UDP-N-acetylmuramoyl-L-alanine--D-glutamate ligase [Alicyclobacillus macrosporangiidus]|uniref:UDP-N-acetylmuramoyl-L-alanine--D-glutamate ligase n=1 Tax=Alicyclobacillus macrosporangiidus TaxID=392015 RepID=UPI0026F284A9|nr:UDP-N-acetylmuramoyl-L-alanine--D-glutamate ligase [Alicyclobacillus macrosporangiidus]MCL6598356.1 UDP-N-acetylmuramoyl-L-alanine--D-glutamate ligase [Alicyclobacillus macrosporangiidus]
MELAGKRVLVMGLARSGEAVARLLLQRGCRVTVNDGRERKADEPEAEALEAMGATVLFGGHPLSLLDDRPDFIIKNPGIPYAVPLLREAQRRGIPIYTEIEVASWVTQAPIVAITGSNGKTTTTTLVGDMLAEAGLSPMVAGNIGRVFAGVVDQVRPEQPVVLEVSSFQLAGVETFRPRVAALLNLYPAHLDYHGTFEAYADAKWRMFKNMAGDDVAVLNADQQILRERAKTLSCRVAWFSRRERVAEGACIEDGEVVVYGRGQRRPVLPVNAIALRGEHNLENALAACAIAVAAGASPSDCAAVLRRFRGVEHRLEFVRDVGGVAYYNDSKSTNPTAALQALRAFEGRIVWIAGGLNRGDDFSPLVPEVQRRVKAAVVLGQTGPALATVCRAAGVPAVEPVQAIEQAVLAAARLAEPGDVVLLSPACASWDMFSSFEERGRIFKEAVHRL